MIYVSVVLHESVGVVAFSLWGAFELHLRSPSAEIGIVGVAHLGCQVTASMWSTLYQT